MCQDMSHSATRLIAIIKFKLTHYSSIKGVENENFIRFDATCFKY
jgi:hypothetical protein